MGFEQNIEGVPRYAENVDVSGEIVESNLAEVLMENERFKKEKETDDNSHGEPKFLLNVYEHSGLNGRVVSIDVRYPDDEKSIGHDFVLGTIHNTDNKLRFSPNFMGSPVQLSGDHKGLVHDLISKALGQEVELADEDEE